MKLPYAFLFAGVMAFLGFRLCAFLAQDACLDAGGTWNERALLCIQARDDRSAVPEARQRE